GQPAGDNADDDPGDDAKSTHTPAPSKVLVDAAIMRRQRNGCASFAERGSFPLARRGSAARPLPRGGRAVPLRDRREGNAIMASDIDLHLGRRLRRRRRLLGLTQQQLAAQVGIRFQQVQKYECGANRISAARLWQLAEALESPVSYFYEGLEEAMERREAGGPGGEVFSRRE